MKLKSISELIDESLNRGALWKNIGTLALPSGKLIVCDPFVGFRNLDTLKKPVRKRQNVPVHILKLYMEEWGNKIVFSKIQFRDTPIKHWKLAEYSWSNDFFVDSGLCCYMDEITGKSYVNFVDTFYQNNPSGNIYDDVFAALFKDSIVELEKGANKIGDWLNFTLPNSTNNICMFQSGIGDGTYQSYWGLTESGEIAALVTDFGLVK